MTVSFSGSIAWKQWIFWEDTKNTVTRISEVPTDPLLNTPYAYSTSNTRLEYELWAISESPIAFSPISPQIYAANSYFTNIVWNYNKEVLTVLQWDYVYVLWVPTLITSETTNLTVEQVFLNQSFAVKNSKTLPWNLLNSLPAWETLKDGNSFVPWAVVGVTVPILYNWTIESLSSNAAKQQFWENIISYYTNSNIWNVTSYENLKNKSDQVIVIVDQILSNSKNSLNSQYTTSPQVVTPDPWCLDPAKIGTVWTGWKCLNLLIVNRTLLDQIIAHDNNPANPAVTVGGVQYHSYLPNGVYTGQVTNFNSLFRDALSFNYDINYWDTSNVTTMRYVFLTARWFNKPLSSWNVANVLDMEWVFYEATNFNQNINTWCVSRFSTQPAWFSYQNQYWTDKASKLPVWGTCP
jgi:surface protein